MILLYDVFSREEKGENKKIPQKATVLQTQATRRDKNN